MEQQLILQGKDGKESFYDAMKRLCISLSHDHH